MIELGGNIKLTGFRELDNGSMIILKKIIGNYTRRISDKCDTFECLEMNLKKIGAKDEKTHPKFEIHSKVICAGDLKTSEVTDRNLFVGVDSSLKKLTNSLAR